MAHSSNDNLSPLSKSDIIHLAVVHYGWKVGKFGKFIFNVLTVDEFIIECDKHLKGESDEIDKKSLIYIVQRKSSQWVTLVFVYQDVQYFAFYIDPRNDDVDSDIANFLIEKNIHCPKIECEKSVDNGVRALRNVECMFRKQNNDFFRIITLHRRIKKTLGDLMEKRSTSETNHDVIKLIDLRKKLETVLNSGLNTTKKIKHLTKTKLHETFLITSGKSYSTMTVGYRDEQFVASYVSHKEPDADDIKKILSDLKIVPILIIDLYIEIDSKKFISKCATEVHAWFDRVSEVTIVVSNAVKSAKTNIELTMQEIGAIRKIMRKVEECQNVFHRQRDKLNEEAITDAAQVNDLLLFLESTALEDMEISAPLKDLVKLGEGIFGKDDWKIIKLIRSHYLLHRDASNRNTVIRPQHINLFIPKEMSKTVFYETFIQYLIQIINKMNGDKPDGEIKICSAFEAEKVMEQIRLEAIDDAEVVNYLLKKFKIFFEANQSEQSIEDITFEFLVNTIPLLECLYSERNRIVDKRLKITALREIQIQRNTCLHNFHKYQSEAARKYEVNAFIDKINPTFFKYAYSQRVYAFLKNYPNDATIDTELQKLLSNLREEYGIGAEGFEDSIPIIGMMIDNSTSSPASVKSFTANYIRIMHLLDNEEEITKRARNYASKPNDQLNPYKRLLIYQRFHNLKKLSSSSQKKSYSEKCQQIKSELSKWGISSETVEKIAELLVEDGPIINEDIIINKVFDDIKTIIDIKARKAIAEISEVVQYYENRETKGDRHTTENLFHSITIGMVKKINDKTISTDRFVVNILELIDYFANRFRNFFINARDAFNDSTFLECLAYSDANFSGPVWEILMGSKRFSPYLVELIVNRKKQFNEENLCQIIDNLVNTDENTVGIHLKKLLEIDNSILFEMLQPNNSNLSVENVKSRLYEKVCLRLNSENMGNICQLLRDKTHAPLLLCELQNFDDMALIRSILDTLDKSCTWLWWNEFYTNLYSIMQSEAIEILKNKLLNFRRTDLSALKVMRRKAGIERKEKKNYADAGEILRDIVDRMNAVGETHNILNFKQQLFDTANQLLPDRPNDLLGFYILIWSDLAYIDNLQKNYSESYSKYETLYKNIISLSSSYVIEDWDEFEMQNRLFHEYDEIISNETYKSILEWHPKYLNILKVMQCMAYERESWARSRENEPDALEKFEEAHKIYCKILNILKKKGELFQCDVKYIQSVASVHYSIGRIKSKNHADLIGALNHYKNAYNLYIDIYDIQVKELWFHHPSNSRTLRDIIEARLGLIRVKTILGGINRGDHSKALEYYREAIHTFENGGFQRYLNECSLIDPQSHIEALKGIAFTHKRFSQFHEMTRSFSSAKDQSERALRKNEEILDISLMRKSISYCDISKVPNDIISTLEYLSRTYKHGELKKLLINYLQKFAVSLNSVFEFREECLPLNPITLNNIIGAGSCLIRVNTMLGEIYGDIPSKPSNDETTTGLEYHRKAAEIFEEVGVYCYLKECSLIKPEIRIKVLKNIALTHERLSKLYHDMKNSEEKMHQSRLALKNYEDIYQCLTENFSSNAMDKDILSIHENIIDTSKYLTRSLFEKGDRKELINHLKAELLTFKNISQWRQEYYDIERTTEILVNIALVHRDLAYSYERENDIDLAMHHSSEFIEHVKQLQELGSEYGNRYITQARDLHLSLTQQRIRLREKREISESDEEPTSSRKIVEPLRKKSKMSTSVVRRQQESDDNSAGEGPSRIRDESNAKRTREGSIEGKVDRKRRKTKR